MGQGKGKSKTLIARTETPNRRVENLSEASVERQSREKEVRLVTGNKWLYENPIMQVPAQHKDKGEKT